MRNRQRIKALQSGLREVELLQSVFKVTDNIDTPVRDELEPIDTAAADELIIAGATADYVVVV